MRYSSESRRYKQSDSDDVANKHVDNVMESGKIEELSHSQGQPKDYGSVDPHESTKTHSL